MAKHSPVVFRPMERVTLSNHPNNARHPLRVILVSLALLCGLIYIGLHRRSGKLHALELEPIASAGETARFETPNREGVSCIAVASVGQKIAAGTLNGSLFLWDRTAPDTPLRLRPADNSFFYWMNSITSVAFSPDSKHLLAGTTFGSIGEWEVATGKFVRVFHGGSGAVCSLTFLPDGHTVLFGSTQKQLGMWNLDTGEKKTTARQRDSFASLALSPDGRFFVTPDGDTINLYELAACSVLRTFYPHQFRVQGAAFTPDGQQIVAASGDGLQVWNVATGDCIRRFSNRCDLLDSMALSPDGKRALTGSACSMQLWDVESGRELTRFEPLAGATKVAFTPDGQCAVSGELWGIVRLWKIP